MVGVVSKMAKDREPGANPANAKMFFELAHAGQRYNDEVPYTTHTEMVVQVLARFGFTDAVMVCAALESTGIPLKTHDGIL